MNDCALYSTEDSDLNTFLQLTINIGGEAFQRVPS